MQKLIVHVIFLAAQTSSREGQTSDTANVRENSQDSVSIGFNSHKRVAYQYSEVVTVCQMNAFCQDKRKNKLAPVVGAICC